MSREPRTKREIELIKLRDINRVTLGRDLAQCSVSYLALSGHKSSTPPQGSSHMPTSVPSTPRNPSHPLPGHGPVHACSHPPPPTRSCDQETLPRPLLSQGPTHDPQHHHNTAKWRALCFPRFPRSRSSLVILASASLLTARPQRGLGEQATGVQLHRHRATNA